MTTPTTPKEKDSCLSNDDDDQLPKSENRSQDEDENKDDGVRWNREDAGASYTAPSRNSFSLHS